MKNKNQKREGRQEQKRLGCLQTPQGGERSVVPTSVGHGGDSGGKVAEAGGIGKCRAQTARLREGFIPKAVMSLWSW